MLSYALSSFRPVLVLVLELLPFSLSLSLPLPMPLPLSSVCLLININIIVEHDANSDAMINERDFVVGFLSFAGQIHEPSFVPCRYIQRFYYYWLVIARSPPPVCPALHKF
ncbi:hypothetical protein ACLKA7_009886 [Drosophila subpalustris]